MMRASRIALRACCWLAFGCAIVPAIAHAMEPLADTALADVRGRDGLSFDLSGFSLSGDARFTYYSPSGASAYVANVSASRSDDTAQPFADPYRLDIVPGAAGQADVITMALPANANGAKRWQFAYDWGTSANGIDFDGGSTVINDAVFYGGGMQWTTPRSGDGIAFGIALRTDIGSLSLQPRGRSDSTEQMSFSGIHIGAVDANGNFTNTPWRIADVGSQPGVLNAVTDSDGKPRLHIGIAWPDAGADAPTGGIAIDNIAFHSDVTGNLDLGASRIGSIQIQYLDIKFRP